MTLGQVPGARGSGLVVDLETAVLRILEIEGQLGARRTVQ